MNTLSELKRKFRSVWPHLDERTRRIMAANEAVSLGYGGVSLVRRACGLSRKAIEGYWRNPRKEPAVGGPRSSARGGTQAH
ncbi:MAG: ISAzo13 family transposase, partial [Acidobacteria bacterium]